MQPLVVSNALLVVLQQLVQLRSLMVGLVVIFVELDGGVALLNRFVMLLLL